MMMRRSSLRILMSLMMVVSGARATCWQPSCTHCQVKVEQESPSQVSLDWSHDWWDLDLNCLDNLVLTLNGESLLRICLERPHSKLSRNANKVLVRILQCCSQC